MHRKLFIGFLVLLLILSTVGCRQKDDEEKAQMKALETVVTDLLSGPDEALVQALNDEATIIVQGVEESGSPPENDKLSTVEKEFGGYFTGDALNRFAGDYLSPYQLFASNSGAEIKTKEVNITKTDSGYDFSARVQYTKGEESGIANVQGDAQLLENGKINSFRIFSDDKLLEWLRSHH